MSMWTVTQLPSQGKAGYAQSLQMRPLTIGELKDYSALLTKDVETRFTNLLRKITREGPPPEELTIGDRDFLLLQTYINTAGKDIKFDVTCAVCGSDNKGIEFDLLEFPVKELEAEEQEFDFEEQTYKVPYLRGSHLMFAEKIGRNEDKLAVALTYATAGAQLYESYLNDPGKVAWFLKVRDIELTYKHGPDYDKVTFECKECASALRFPVIELLSI